MGDERDPLAQCRQQVANEPRSINDIIEQQSAAMGSLLKASEIESCKTGTVVGIGLLPVFAAGGSFQIGCEQIAALSLAMDASQRVQQCAVKNFSNSTSTTAVSNLVINVEILGTFIARNCTVEFTQTSDLNITVVNQLSNDIKEAMNAEVKSSLEGFLENLQNEDKKGLFATSSGQKVFQTMTQNVQNILEQETYTNVVNDTLTSFTQSGLQTFKVGAEGTMEFFNDYKGDGLQPCFKVTQTFAMNAVAQNIITNTYALVFDAQALADLKAALKALQDSKSDSGFTFPSFGFLLIAVVVGIIIISLLFSKKQNNETKQPQPVLTGSAARILGIVLMVVGFAAVITAIVLMLLKKNPWLCWGVLIGGAILAIIGIVVYVRYKSQEAMFQQKLKLAQTKAGTTT